MKASSGVIGHCKTMHNLELRVDTIVSASHQNVYIRIQDVRRSILGREGCQEGKAQEGQNFALVGSVIKLLGGEVWRRDRDSNPGYLAVYTLSKRAPSATRPSLRCVDATSLKVSHP